jgi:hypothetical protein
MIHGDARNSQRAGAWLRSLAEPALDTTKNFAELMPAMLGVAAKLEHRASPSAPGRANANAKGRGRGRGRG